MGRLLFGHFTGKSSCGPGEKVQDYESQDGGQVDGASDRGDDSAEEVQIGITDSR